MYLKEPPNSGRLEGIWKNGELNGQCTYYYPDESKLIGNWKNGNMKLATFVSKDGQSLIHFFYYSPTINQPTNLFRKRGKLFIG